MEILNEITLGVVNVVLIALGGLVGTAVKRWMRKHGQDERVAVVRMVVKYVEQMAIVQELKTKVKVAAEEKLYQATQTIKNRYPWLAKNEDDLRYAIEAAVKEMNEAK